MIQQEYTVRPPRGIGYRIVVEIRDEPIVASRGSRTLSLDAAWVSFRQMPSSSGTRISWAASYFSGFLKGLHTIGILNVLDMIKSSRPRPPLNGKGKRKPLSRSGRLGVIDLWPWCFSTKEPPGGWAFRRADKISCPGRRPPGGRPGGSANTPGLIRPSMVLCGGGGRTARLPDDLPDPRQDPGIAPSGAARPRPDLPRGLVWESGLRFRPPPRRSESRGWSPGEPVAGRLVWTV